MSLVTVTEPVDFKGALFTHAYLHARHNGLLDTVQ